jgi:signal transduction histidine kinase
VHRHAGAGATATVDVVVGGQGHVEVAVRDDGRAPTNMPSNGFGIVGMRERVESTGGTLRAGPRADRGFEVVAIWDRRA